MFQRPDVGSSEELRFGVAGMVGIDAAEVLESIRQGSGSHFELWLVGATVDIDSR